MGTMFIGPPKNRRFKPRPRALIAKWSSTCPRCGEFIAVNDTVIHWPSQITAQGKSLTYCLKCGNELYPAWQMQERGR